MEVLQPELKFLTDYGGDLSFYDIADITKAYKCTGMMRKHTNAYKVQRNTL